MANACNPSTGEAEAEGLQVWGQPGPHSKFQTSLGYLGKRCLKNQTTKSVSKDLETLEQHLCCFHILATISYTAMSISVQYHSEMMLSIYLDIYTSRFVGHIVFLFLIFWGASILILIFHSGCYQEMHCPNKGVNQERSRIQKAEHSSQEQIKENPQDSLSADTG
jgi:hypothetical protein